MRFGKEVKLRLWRLPRTLELASLIEVILPLPLHVIAGKLQGGIVGLGKKSWWVSRLEIHESRAWVSSDGETETSVVSEDAFWAGVGLGKKRRTTEREMRRGFCSGDMGC